MTSIEWLKDWMTKNQYFIGNDLLVAIEQAKEMHKQEIVNTYIIADSESTIEDSEHNAEEYYQREFISNGSNATSDFEKPFMDFAKQYFKPKK